MIAKNIYIGLGSNIGHRADYLHLAIEEMEMADIKVVRKSAVYESEPWGLTAQPPFLNQVIEIACSYPPDILLQLLKSIEKKVGREIRGKWEHREIDLDILFYGNQIINASHLHIPHRYVHERNFVLVPMDEIASHFTDPETGKTIHELLKMSEDKSRVELYNPPV